MEKPTKKPRKLSDKQTKFIHEYLIDLNATQAAIRAGYSEKTAARIASENLSKLDIQAAIQQKRDEIEEARGISPESIIKGLQYALEVASGAKPTLVQIDTTEEGKPSYGSIEVRKTDLNNYLKAHDMLMKHLGLYEKHQEQGVSESQVVIYELPDNGR